MTDVEGVELPLSRVRLVDMTDGRSESCGRLLAKLGADVVLVEPPRGITARSRPPFAAGTSVHFATHHASMWGLQAAAVAVSRWATASAPSSRPVAM